MTTRMAQAKTSSNGSAVVVAPHNSGNVSDFVGVPAARPAFKYLASAYPAAKVDPEGDYWVTLSMELADVAELVLKTAVQEYIRTNENAYRLPTVAELLKLCRKHAEHLKAEVQAEREVAQQREYEAQQEELRRVTRSVPQADRDEIAARVKAAFNISPDWVTAFQLIYTYLLDTTGPQVGWYSPTMLIATGMSDKLRAGRPTGDPSQSPPQTLVEQITGAFPSRFRAGYDKRLEPLLNPDRIPWEGGL